MYTSIISHINDFMAHGLKRPISVPKAAAWRMALALAKGPSNDILMRYAKARALNDSDEALFALGMMLQRIEPLLDIVKIDAEGSGFPKKQLPDGRYAKLSLSEKLALVKASAGWARIDLDPICDYLTACRNIYVHSGQIIASKGRNDLADLVNGYRPGIVCDAYLDICSMVLALLTAYRYSLDKRGGAMAIPWLWIELQWCKARRGFAFVMQMFRWLGKMLGRALSLACGLTMVAVALLVFLAICGIFNDCSRHHDDKVMLSQAKPEQLAAWVEEMSPLEQMERMDARQSSLRAYDNWFAYGDSAVCYADKRTEELYLWAVENKMPNPNKFLVKTVANCLALSRMPVVGIPFNAKGDPTPFMHGKKDRESYQYLGMGIDPDKLKNWDPTFMPVYEQGYFPLCVIDSERGTFRNCPAIPYLRAVAPGLAKQPGLSVHICLGIRPTQRRAANVEKNAQMIDLVMQTLTGAGIPRSRISISESPRECGIKVYVKGIPTE